MIVHEPHFLDCHWKQEGFPSSPSFLKKTLELKVERKQTFFSSQNGKYCADLYKVMYGTTKIVH